MGAARDGALGHDAMTSVQTSSHQLPTLVIVLPDLYALGTLGARWVARLCRRPRRFKIIALRGPEASPGIDAWLSEHGINERDFDRLDDSHAFFGRRHGLSQGGRSTILVVDPRRVVELLAPDGSRAERETPGRAKAGGHDPVLLGLGADATQVEALDHAGVDAVCRDPEEVLGWIEACPLAGRLGLVLLAFNEEDSITRAVGDARRFGQLFAESYEVVVVDDGSTDATAARLVDLAGEDLHVVTHAKNQGMGAGLRDGFAAARCDYVAPFPADRQVRPQALIPLLPHLGPQSAGLGYYPTPHAPGVRALLSAGFRATLRWVGGLRVPFDGTYCFSRALFDEVNPRRTASGSFVYSYELLDQLRRQGCQFTHRPVRPFLRQAGASKVANPRRVARVFSEIVRSRLRGLGI
ncbi:MAG: glycosyltransferase [Deltaproteobacteria bacterium]|nr:glycosyltransferase [Deltaproteobacteria bacterium]